MNINLNQQLNNPFTSGEEKKKLLEQALSMFKKSNPISTLKGLRSNNSDYDPSKPYYSTNQYGNYGYNKAFADKIIADPAQMADQNNRITQDLKRKINSPWSSYYNTQSPYYKSDGRQPST